MFLIFVSYVSLGISTFVLTLHKYPSPAFWILVLVASVTYTWANNSYSFALYWSTHLSVKKLIKGKYKRVPFTSKTFSKTQNAKELGFYGLATFGEWFLFLLFVGIGSLVPILGLIGSLTYKNDPKSLNILLAIGFGSMALYVIYPFWHFWEIRRYLANNIALIAKSSDSGTEPYENETNYEIAYRLSKNNQRKYEESGREFENLEPLSSVYTDDTETIEILDDIASLSASERTFKEKPKNYGYTSFYLKIIGIMNRLVFTAIFLVLMMVFVAVNYRFKGPLYYILFYIYAFVYVMAAWSTVSAVVSDSYVNVRGGLKYLGKSFRTATKIEEERVNDLAYKRRTLLSRYKELSSQGSIASKSSKNTSSSDGGGSGSKESMSPDGSKSRKRYARASTTTKFKKGSITTTTTTIRRGSEAPPFPLDEPNFIKGKKNVAEELDIYNTVTPETLGRPSVVVSPPPGMTVDNIVDRTAENLLQLEEERRQRRGGKALLPRSTQFELREIANQQAPITPEEFYGKRPPGSNPTSSNTLTKRSNAIKNIADDLFGALEQT
ncbi:MAG: hypothetical protein ACTSUE_07680 [Promethearchaeota archaeon]